MPMPSPPQPGCLPTRRFFRSERKSLVVLPALLGLACAATIHRPALDPRALVCRQVEPNHGQAVSWIAPDVERDRVRLTEWCAAVGPVLYEPPASGSGGDARPLDRVALVSWNTHVGGGDVDAVLARIRAGEFTAGDFNAWLGEREPAIKALRRAFPEVPPIAQPTWTGPLGVRAPLDHVFARGELAISVQRLPDRFGSDHFPLLAVIRF
jgi:hypothetical protein